MLGIFVHVNVK